MKTVFISLITILISLSGYSQCVTENTAFSYGEELTYTGYYNWGFVWVAAGRVKLKVEESTYNATPSYKITGVGRNAKAYDWFFKLRDTVITHMDASNLKPLYLDRRTHEGKYHARHIYKFDNDKNTISTSIKKRNKKTKKGSVEFQDCINNILSVLYYARNIDFDSYTSGDIIPIDLIVDGKISNVEIRYYGTEEVKTKNKKEYNCYKFTPVLPKGSMFKGGDDMVIWLSNDANRVPIMVEGKVSVGSVKGILENYSGLRTKEGSVLGSTNGTFEKSDENID